MKLFKQTLSDQIYDVLKMEIIKQEIPFGSKLINRQLQKRFGVSSSPVRDAINRLYQDGLIEKINQSGATVVSLNLDFYLEVNEVLLCLAETGVRLAGEKADIDEVVPKLRYYIDLQKKYIDTDKYYNYDYDFHKTFIDFSENRRLTQLFKQNNVLHEVLVRHFYEPETKQMRKNSIATHEKITDEFEKGNYRRAMDLMELHYKTAENIFRKMISKEKISK